MQHYSAFHEAEAERKRVKSLKDEEHRVAAEKARGAALLAARKTGKVVVRRIADYHLNQHAMLGAAHEATLVPWVRTHTTDKFNEQMRLHVGYRNITVHIPDFKDGMFEYPDYLSVYEHKDDVNKPVYVMFSDVKNGKLKRDKRLFTSKFQYEMITGNYDLTKLDRLRGHPSSPQVRELAKRVLLLLRRETFLVEGLYYATYVENHKLYGAVCKPLVFLPNNPN